MSLENIYMGGVYAGAKLWLDTFFIFASHLLSVLSLHVGSTVCFLVTFAQVTVT